MEEILDHENMRMADSLASKVTRLKAVSGGPLERGPERGEASKGFMGTWT